MVFKVIVLIKDAAVTAFKGWFMDEVLESGSIGVVTSVTLGGVWLIGVAALNGVKAFFTLLVFDDIITSMFVLVPLAIVVPFVVKEDTEFVTCEVEMKYNQLSDPIYSRMYNFTFLSCVNAEIYNPSKCIAVIPSNDCLSQY